MGIINYLIGTNGSQVLVTALGAIIPPLWTCCGYLTF